MNVKDTFLGILFAFVCLNAGFTLLTGLNIRPAPIEAWNSTQFEENFNGTDMVTSMEYRTDDYSGHIIDAINVIWDWNIPIVESFTAFLSLIGTPAIVVNVVKIPYRFMIGWFIFALWSGRL